MSNHKLKLLHEHLQTKFKPQVDFVKRKIENFRPYDLGGLAINGLTPKKGYQTRHNVAYGLKSRQRMDLYVSDAEQSKSLIVFVHGGAWTRGDKSSYKFVGEAFARFGHDVVVINYHLAPDHIFPSYVDDLVVALNYLELNQEKLEISTSNIILMGHSAGAFNIASLIYHPQVFEFKNKQNIKALIGISGPYHFDYKGDALAEHAFDHTVNYKQVMPYYYVAQNPIQHYLLLAEQDKLVKHSNTYDLEKQLKACGNHCEVITIPKTGHISIMGSVSSLFSPFFKTRQAILQAIEQSLK